LRKYEDPSVWDIKPEDLVVRRTEGYAAIEKRMKEKHIDLCSVQRGEAIGNVSPDNCSAFTETDINTHLLSSKSET